MTPDQQKFLDLFNDFCSSTRDLGRKSSPNEIAQAMAQLTILAGMIQTKGFKAPREMFATVDQPILDVGAGMVIAVFSGLIEGLIKDKAYND